MIETALIIIIIIIIMGEDIARILINCPTVDLDIVCEGKHYETVARLV